MPTSAQIIEETEQFGAHNYHPLPVVISEARGVWLYDVEGKRYLDFLAAYSAVNQGHSHPRLLAALKRQAGRCCLTSRAFHNDQLGPFCRELARFCGKETVLPMNTGAEAVETAIKLARRWGYQVKSIPEGEAEIIVCENNFHGRTTTIVGFSSDEPYKRGFGPFTPGFKLIPYGDTDELSAAVTDNTCAFLLEPIQGEAGVIVPPEGFLRQAQEICRQRNVLLMADEIQTAFGRTGKRFACDHEDVVPDVYILGKALAGGLYPVSAVVADKELMDLFRPGDHGSTFGGNPLGAAVAREALNVIIEESHAVRSAELGNYFMGKLRKIDSPHIDHVRGRGLFIGVVLREQAGGARRFCESLMQLGLLCKETHENVIRFAPPLVIEHAELDWAIERIRQVLTGP